MRQGGVLLLAGSDVGGEFDDLHGLAVGVEDRVVGGFDPHRLAAFAQPLELGRLETSLAQTLPEGGVVDTAAKGRLDEDAMMRADDLVETVTHHREEILVGVEDDAVEIEFDHRLRARDRVDLAQQLGMAGLLHGDVGGELDHADRLAAAPTDRIVGRFEPDLAAILGDTAELGDAGLAAVQYLPEGVIVGRVALGRIDEHGMVPAHDLVLAVAHRLEEGAVGGHDGAVHAELDHRQRTVEGCQPRRCAQDETPSHVSPLRTDDSTTKKFIFDQSLFRHPYFWTFLSI